MANVRTVVIFDLESVLGPNNCERKICLARDIVRHGGTNAKMTVSTENSHFLVNYSPSD